MSKTVNVKTAGTLSTLFTLTEMNIVTNLTLTGNINAQDFKFMRDGINNLAVLDINAVTIKVYTGNGGTSSSNITTYPANEIPANALQSTSVTSVIIPNSVTSIGAYAYYNCRNLTSITIGNSVLIIGSRAFAGCGLTSLTIPNSVTTLEGQAFGSCSRLISVTFGNSVTSIGSFAFEGCVSLTSIAIPNSVTHIGNFAFQNCSRLKSITIPNAVTTIGDETFSGCSGLTSITIPNSVTSIGYLAFMDCTSLTSVTIPNSVTTIGSFAFSGCTRLTSIYSYLITPVALSGVFTSVNVNNCILYVPAGTKSAYKAKYGWNSFINIIEMAPTALSTLLSESVNIYPNPVLYGFNIDGLIKSSTLDFMDLSGKILLSKQVKNNEYVTISSFPKGVYIVKISTANSTIERKVIKE